MAKAGEVLGAAGSAAEGLEVAERVVAVLEAVATEAAASKEAEIEADMREAVTGARVTEAARAVGSAAAAMDEDLVEGSAEGRAVVEREAAMPVAAVEVGLVAAAMVEVAKEAVVTVVAARPPSAQRP